MGKVDNSKSIWELGPGLHLHVPELKPVDPKEPWTSDDRVQPIGIKEVE